MPHPFEIEKEIELAATPEQVWEAIATGPGVDSWFMGRNEIEPKLGGTASMAMGDFTSTSTITEWQPPHRFAYKSDENPDGTFMAFEYLVEGRGAGSTVLRFVHSGFLGDDWEAEYDALTNGDWMYLLKLAAYLEHFVGRTSTYSMLTPGPQLTDKQRVWAAFNHALGVSAVPSKGDRVRLDIDGLPPADGEVVFVDPANYIGVVTGESIYTFMHGYQDTVVVEQHSFAADVDAKATDAAWQAWLARTFA